MSTITNTTVSSINIVSLRKLAVPYSNKMTHFIRTACRLYGRLCFYEVNYGENGVMCFEAAEVRSADVKEDIVRIGKEVAQAITTLNFLAEKQGLPPVLRRMGSMNLTDAMYAVVDFVEAYSENIHEDIPELVKEA